MTRPLGLIQSENFHIGSSRPRGTLSWRKWEHLHKKSVYVFTHEVKQEYKHIQWEQERASLTSSWQRDINQQEERERNEDTADKSVGRKRTLFKVHIHFWGYQENAKQHHCLPNVSTEHGNDSRCIQELKLSHCLQSKQWGVFWTRLIRGQKNESTLVEGVFYADLKCSQV